MIEEHFVRDSDVKKRPDIFLVHGKEAQGCKRHSKDYMMILASSKPEEPINGQLFDIHDFFFDHEALMNLRDKIDAAIADNLTNDL